MSEQRNEIDDVSGVATTGHEWDGIKELDNPLPRWWLIIFYATIAFAAVYWVMMPAWPTLSGFTHGVRNYSDRAVVAQELDSLRSQRAPEFARLMQVSAEQAEQDPALMTFARAAGRAAFGDNCATCHGASGQGQLGYPNLQDDVWLWDGTLDGIVHTLNVGIRSGHPQTQANQMPAFGLSNMLTREQIGDVTEYVVQLSSARSGETFDAGQAARGAAIFQAQCVSCHGAGGEGQATRGAPSLIDDIWLYGGSRQQIREQIVTGRAGVMPAWSGRLDAETIKMLSVYVHSLGGGEAAPAPPAPVAAQ
jgi:cytochrome c oxidase cbb3-type subunit 3